MAKESMNKVTLSGKIVEIESREGMTKKQKPYIGGTIKVETAEDNIIPVSFFAAETTNAGKDNPIYKSLQTVITDFKTIQNDTRELADSIEISGARLSENIFFPQSDRMIRGFQVQAAFFNRKAAVSPVNEFIVSGEILDVIEDVVDDVPTGTLTVRLLVVGYNNQPNLLDFKVEDPAGVKYILSTFIVGQEVKVNGQIIIDETIDEIKEATGFGDPIVNTVRKTERKLLITSATPPADTQIPADEKMQMLAVRESGIQEKKAAADAPAPANKSSSAGDFTL